MAYLFKHEPPRCASFGCRQKGLYDVRGGVPIQSFDPLCLKHAQSLYAHLAEQEDKHNRPPIPAAPEEPADA